MSEKTGFWKPEPKELHKDWRMWCLLVPLVVESVGFVLQGLFTFALGDIQIISQFWQSLIVLIGGGMLVFGSEMGTIATGVEVYRRMREGTAVKLDKAAIVTSAVATLANIIISLASRVAGGYEWGKFVLEFGPIVLGVALVGDYIGSIIELSAMDADHNARVAEWMAEEAAYFRTASKPRQKKDERFTKLQQQLVAFEQRFNLLPKPHPRKVDFDNWLANLNGNGEKLKTIDDVMLAMSEVGWNPIRQDVRRWFEVKK